MLKIYKSKNDEPFKRSICWLDKFKIPYKIITKTELLFEDLKQILSLSDKGFEEILVSKKKGPRVYNTLPENFDEMHVEELIEFLLRHQSVLKTPIIFDESHLLIGYNSEAIRVFAPRIRKAGKLNN